MQPGLYYALLRLGLHAAILNVEYLMLPVVLFLLATLVTAYHEKFGRAHTQSTCTHTTHSHIHTCSKLFRGYNRGQYPLLNFLFKY